MSNTQNTRYEVLTEEDPNTGDIILPFPPELLEKMGWKEGDTLEFAQDVDGAWIIKKVVK
jgi:bifunctional DNA-binding transcriptional regulator/antitoxin component of YhaV-PrlF toxin-antitoxin module